MLPWEGPSLINWSILPDWFDSWRAGQARLITGDGQGHLAVISDQLSGPRLWLQSSAGCDYDSDRWSYLGHVGTRPVFVGVDDLKDRLGLRQLLPIAGGLDQALAVRAVALLGFHENQRYCSRCGTPGRLQDLGRSRHCPRCDRDYFPRVDPSMIVSVVDGDDRLLLGHHVGWPAQQRSVLAGFVEAGESVEQTVRREVMEEVGLVVDRVNYLGSQPWPMPQSLMLAFSAQATSGQLTPDGQEITHAEWYGRDDFRQALLGAVVTLPPAGSIARWMISRWLGEKI
ncbi:MAG: NAD(+) diphosphatase [Propionibacteriaceae bacterium]|jgi:NAD+ diphosphatase|nr:NAD(+) diphosphatase [Propionibacteriaceae bacterium]